MPIQSRWTAILAIVLLCHSCNRNAVSLSYTNAADEVPQLGNLVFRFDKPLVNDSLLNQWDSTEYISFEPHIAGQFRWEHPDELIFSPAAPLPPATSFKAKFHNDLLSYSKFGSLKGTDKVSFHTPALKLDNITAAWVLPDGGTGSAVPQVAVYFNYPVTPDVLKTKLHINSDGHPMNFALSTASENSRIAIRLPDLKMEDRDVDLQVVLDEGLLPKGGSTATKEKINVNCLIPSPYRLSINEVTADHDGTTGTIRIVTSQQLTAANLSSFVSVSPSVKFDVEVQDDGFLVRSEQFDQSKSYALTIAKGLRGRIGGTLHEDYTNNIAFGALQPSISFVNSKGIYLSAKGNQNIEVKITAVKKVKVIISKIYENNLLAAQRYGYTPTDARTSTNNENSEEGDEGDYGADYNASPNFGDIIYQQEIDTRSLPKSGSNRILHLDVADRLPEFKGIYHVMVRSTDDYWVRDNRFISSSDIGLIVKEGRDAIMVFANSIKDAAPMQGVNTVVYGANNQVLAMGTTDANGVANISYGRKEFAGFRPAMVIAKTASDFNYISFSSTRVNTSRFEVNGRRSNSTGLDAFIYPERDIYRPGETIHFSVIIRDRQWKIPADMPIKLKLLLPNGKELKSFRKNINDQGSLDGSVDIAESAITGSYSLEVYTSNDVLLNTQAFRIEEFVPDRIKVTAELDKKDLEPGNKTTLGIHAVNFFGPPAANRNYECEIQVSQKYFLPKNFSEFDFSLSNQRSFIDKVNREGKTDANGDAQEVYTVPDMYKNIGILQADFYTTVFDETGRPVSRKSTTQIFTQNIFFGIASDGLYYYSLNKPVQFQLAAVDKNENPSKGSALVEVIKHEYKTVLTKSGSYFRYESQQEDKVVSSSTVSVSGKNTPYSFTPHSPGNYELRVSIPGSNTYVSKDFYSYGSWGSESQSFEVSNEGNVDISINKASYTPGETVKALFKTPFSGKMLVTLESEKVISYQVIDVADRTATLNLKVTADALPNAYITATLIKPHGISDIPLTVAHGFQNVIVEEKDRHMTIAINAKQAVRSKTHQQVVVKAEAGSMVTLAAVDNGVLQVSNFESPDPYGFFYARRALEVNAYDIYPLLLPEVAARYSSTGGDADNDMSKRANPMPAKRIKILSYWSGIVQADRNGEAKFEFDIPQFSGEVRLMAVAYKNEQFGAQTSSMRVADPIVLSTALPRFLSPRDSITVPVTISNTTNNVATISATLKTNGLLQVVGNATQDASIAPNSEYRAVFTLVTPANTGISKVTAEVMSKGEKFSEETEIGIRPAGSLQKITGGGVVQGGANLPLNLPVNDFIPSSIHYSLTVSRSPVAEIGKQLQYLVEYPYGCTEQTVSIAFPQLYINDLANLQSGSTANVNANIQEAIRKIKMRQLYNGGIMLWDDEGTESWWASIYAAHFLIEAKKAGYDVDKSLLETLLGYVNNRLSKRETITYYYNRNQNRKIVSKESIYGLYVLSLAGKPNVSTMNYYKSNPSLLSLDCKYMLAAAYALAGDKASFRQFLPSQFAGEESIAATGGSFYSDIRDEALALNVLIDVDPTNSQIATMAGHVADKLKQRSWYSTQELAFTFVALGKLSREASKSTATADIVVDGKTLGSMKGNSVTFTSKQLKNTSVSINSHGQGSIYYSWQTEGISSSGTVKEEDNYLKIRRRFFDRYGRQLSGNTFKQNDLIIVQLTLEKPYSTDIDNVVITDILPAGFEIENPRTKDIPGMEWIKDQHSPTALDVRDDRINLFVDAHQNKQTYYYAVRAVSPGVYRMGAASADAMYNGEYHSYNGAGTIIVK